MKGSPESCEAQQGGVIQSIPVNKMQWKEAVQLTRCLQKRYLMRYPFKIKLLSKAAFLFLILILFKANRAVSAPGNDTDCSKQRGLKPDLQCHGMANVVLLLEWPGEKHPALIGARSDDDSTLS